MAHLFVVYNQEQQRNLVLTQLAYLCYRSMDCTPLLCHNQEQLRTVVSMDGDNNLLYAQKIKSHLVKRIFPICKNLLRKMRDHEKICMVGISQNP